MSSIYLLGIPNKLKTLLDRWTSTRAGYLDTIYSRVTGSVALASTALSTATWTNTRAGKLDNLNATISSRLATAINSVQNGTAILSSVASMDVTVSSVDVDKCLILIDVYAVLETGGTAVNRGAYGFMASSTTLRLRTYGTSQSVYLNWQIVEFN